MTLSPADNAKRAAAAQALGLVTPGMRLGLGSGSTAAWFVRLLGERVRAGLDVACVATSSGTVRIAEAEGVPLTTLAELGRLELTVDGADEIDPDLALIKGGGAALLQEKIVAAASDRFVIVGDDSKRITTLGAFPLPVEVVRFGWTATRDAIAALLARADVGGREIVPRMSGEELLVTDEGHFILDLHLRRIGDAEALAAALNAIPGVVESGLFVGMAERAIIGHVDGRVEEILPSGPARDDFVDEAMRSADA
ncbi:ribose-5-phosphate isomerase RpiA [Amaricoccus sp.]|uniref:ribose-5-phosphate isomerase RpiA n=1 Tax=Amaricoccus sp. TaxID=1872485 RepID=UPI001B597EE9|nr:ribose-5-phosphate isomerase RpiA [Amaricoccus sp.]MBP7000132.1 ribose-5-phosphate isomerase RpiA [Amaricoccus sp.]